MNGPKQEKKPNPFYRNDAVVYIRMSTSYQVQTDSNSSEMQRKACENLCRDKGLPIKKVIEQVKSGRKYRKDLFDVIQKEMRPGNSIVVYSISRFARKQLHAHELLEILRKKKCRLLSVTENMDTSVDDANLGLFAWLAELESRQTSARVKSSLQAKKERGEHIGSMPYGFQYQDGKGSPLEKNEEEMEVLEKMRTWFNQDKLTYLQIARKLNNEGILSPKTKQVGGWIDKTVKKLVHRDDMEILCKGKRSWYLNKQQQEQQQREEEERERGEEEETGVEKSSPAEEESSEEEDNGIEEGGLEKEESSESGEAGESSNQTTVTAGQETTSLSSKPFIVLKAMLTKRRLEFGLSEENIQELTKEDMIELLNCE